MSKRVLCKFFAHGACLKGDHCEFSHDWKAAPNNVCTFYQKGACSYGNRCRYDHVKVSRSHSSTGSSSANSLQFAVSDSATVTHPSGSESSGLMAVSSVNSELSATSRPFFPPGNLAWNQNSGLQSLVDHDDIGEPNSLDPADRAICSFAAAGICPRGEKCPHVHGDLCPCCGKHCLHPFRPQEREEHIKLCQKKQKHLDALKHSQEIECSVCLERVLSKPTAAERKFGLLSECDHPFCISCIRNWRSSSPSSGMDVNSTLRACPICRKVSFFVIPSVIWYSTKEEKQEIVDSYKTKLRSIDCKHFDFGNGTCPFGTSCFYKHTVKPGSHIWNYNLMRDCYSSHSSYDEDIDGIHLLFKYLYKSHSAIGVQDLEDYGDEDYDFDDYTDPFHEDYQNYDFDDFTNPYQDFENEMFQELLNYSDEDLENDVPMTEEMARFLSMMALGGLSDSSGDED